MFKRILALLLIVPVIEMLILIESGRRFGFWPTLGFIVVMGIIGIVLIRSQGFVVINNIKLELAHGQIPTSSVLEGMIIIASGLLLLTPGLLTDFIGLTLLIPPVRNYAKIF
ncbi:hypothetical protein N752_08550 [Desulforamulus aquiferis]|nr:FxsA family protein [Desulforamulus aquiferis]RYD05383.1 hypothetical protein N752_08550 [Desulforamulus aquiferis]